MSRRRQIVVWAGGGLVLLLVLGALVARFAIYRYIQGESFRQLVGRNTSRTLKAEAEFLPFQLNGATLSSDLLRARGLEHGWFSDLAANQVRADLSFGRVLEGVWQVDRVEVENAELQLSGPRLPLVEAVRERSEASPAASASPWWPQRVEVQAANLHHAQVRWDGGRLRDVAVQGERVGNEWKFKGDGGRLEQGNYPPLEVRSFRLRQRENFLFVENAELRQVPSGVVTVNGEVRLGEALDLEAKLDRMPLEPLMEKDWRARLSGNLNGTVRVRSPLPAEGAMTLSGSLTLTEGSLEALPVLNELALFTQLAQFRRLTLGKVEGYFVRTDERLAVSRLVADCPGLMRVEGGFTIEAGQIKGDFQVGLAPATMQWLPGVRTKLFTVARDSYVWAPMHLDGPVESPHEDLSAKLLAAMAEGGVDTVRKATEALPAPLQDAAKKALDFFMK